MAVVYCNRCGAENKSTRGACLRCFNPLDWPPGGVSCGACGADNAAEARYCAECSDVLVDLGDLPECTLAGAINLILGAEEEFAFGDEEDFIGGAAADDEIGPAGVPDLDFEEADAIGEPVAEEAFVPPPPVESEPEVVEESIAEEAPPPPPPVAEDVDLGEEEEEAEEELFEPVGEFAPPPPPPGAEDIDPCEEDSVEDEEELFEPVAAEPEEGPGFEPVVEEAPVFEAVETPASEDEPGDDEFAGLDFELDEEEAVAEEPDAKDEEKEEQSEDELGGWVIDFGDEE